MNNHIFSAVSWPVLSCYHLIHSAEVIFFKTNNEGFQTF